MYLIILVVILELCSESKATKEKENQLIEQLPISMIELWRRIFREQRIHSQPGRCGRDAGDDIWHNVCSEMVAGGQTLIGVLGRRFLVKFDLGTGATKMLCKIPSAKGDFIYG